MERAAEKKERAGTGEIRSRAPKNEQVNFRCGAI